VKRIVVDKVLDIDMHKKVNRGNLEARLGVGLP